MLCLLCNAIDLARSKDHISVSGDGTSDHDILLGVQEYFAFCMEFVDYKGERKAMFADGFLKSFGLTSDEEVSTCDAILMVSLYFS